jgi:hypothetical protein
MNFKNSQTTTHKEAAMPSEPVIQDRRPSRWLTQCAVLATALLLSIGCGESEGDTSARASVNAGGSSSGVSLFFMVSNPEDGADASAESDRVIYEAGSMGTAGFRNETQMPLFLPGCAPFVFERSLDGAWTFADPPIVCVWEGLAVAVYPNEIDEFDFLAPNNSGTYRLRYDYSSGCELDLPLSQANCENDFVVLSDEFEVERELCDPAEPSCRFVPGAPNLLCPDGVNIAGPSAECTRAPGSGECGYEILRCP